MMTTCWRQTSSALEGHPMLLTFTVCSMTSVCGEQTSAPFPPCPCHQQSSLEHQQQHPLDGGQSHQEGLSRPSNNNLL